MKVHISLSKIVRKVRIWRPPQNCVSLISIMRNKQLMIKILNRHFNTLLNVLNRNDKKTLWNVNTFENVSNIADLCTFSFAKNRQTQFGKCFKRSCPQKYEDMKLDQLNVRCLRCSHIVPVCLIWKDLKSCGMAMEGETFRSE